MIFEFMAVTSGILLASSIVGEIILRELERREDSKRKLRTARMLHNARVRDKALLTVASPVRPFNGI